MVIYNGVDRTPFYSRDTTPDEEYVLFVGHNERTGLSTVLEYARESPLQVYVAVRVDLFEPEVNAVGRVDPDRLAELYSGAVATIHPAKFEAFGNIVLESLSCGTPVVTTRDCGASEIVRADAGFVGTNISEGVESVRDIEEKACLEVARNHVWENVAERTVAVMNEIDTR